MLCYLQFHLLFMLPRIPAFLAAAYYLGVFFDLLCQLFIQSDFTSYVR